LWQPSGFLLLYTRLERGTFKRPRAPSLGHRHIEMDSAELALMIEGIDLRDARRRARWIPQNAVASRAAM
jgi:transposase